jgi:chromosome segregation ATPase
MTEQSNNSNFWQGFGRFMRGLVRLVLFGLLVAIVVVALYYAIPYAYSYMVQPVQNNRVVIDHLRRTQAQVEDQLADQRERIAQLEADLAAEREARSQLESLLSQQSEALSAQATVQAELETGLETQGQETLTQVEFEERFDAPTEAIVVLEQRVDTLDASLAELNTTVTDMEQAATTPDRDIESLQQQALIGQAAQVVLKARVHLSENNPGQAQLALERAEVNLEELASLIPSEKEEELTEIQTQLETVITAVAEQPFIAIQELEILWELLQRFAG